MRDADEDKVRVIVGESRDRVGITFVVVEGVSRRFPISSPDPSVHSPCSLEALRARVARDSNWGLERSSVSSSTMTQVRRDDDEPR